MKGEWMWCFFRRQRVEISEVVVRSLWPGEEMDFAVVDSDGLSGGLLCIWKPSVFALSRCCCNRNFILLSGTIAPSFLCVLISVYAPNEVFRRELVWESITRLKASFNVPWCLGGDFNEIRNIGERKGCSRRERGMKHFNDFIDRMEVVELDMLGRKYTWCNAAEGEK